MDRQRNEIRLLRILPPTFVDPERLFEVSDDVLRCEMLYVSLDDVAAGKIVSSEISAGMGALSLQDPGSAIGTAASSAASRSETQKERIARLSRLWQELMDFLPRMGWSISTPMTMSMSEGSAFSARISTLSSEPTGGEGEGFCPLGPSLGPPLGPFPGSFLLSSFRTL
jgi:hypothetical protein